MVFSDVDRVFEIATKSLDEQYVHEIFYFFMANWPSGQLVAVDTFGKIVGFITGTRVSQDNSSVMMFAVDPDQRNKGIGESLLREFCMRTVMDGRQYIQLEVRNTNTVALTFYTRRGFREAQYLCGFYNDGGDAVRLMRHASSRV